MTTETKTDAAAVDFVATVIGNDPLVNAADIDGIVIPAYPTAAPITLDVPQRATFIAPRKALAEIIRNAAAVVARLIRGRLFTLPAGV